MSGPTPSYYPAGWGRERMLNAAASREINDLTPEQRDAFREGLRADLGQQGFDEFFDEMFRRETEASGDAAAKTIVKEPPFMEVLRLCEDRGARWDQWGFVVYKSPEIVDEARWAACKQRFLQIIHESVDPYRGYAGLDECIQKMTFQWVEVGSGEGGGSVESIAQTYTSATPAPGLHHSVCLYVTPPSMDSILDSPLPSSSKRQYRTNIPFVVAVSADAGGDDQHDTKDQERIEGATWRGFFNVAVETILDSLFPILADNSMTPSEIGGRISGDDIWCDHTRWGVHKAGGIGYYNSRTGQI